MPCLAIRAEQLGLGPPPEGNIAAVAAPWLVGSESRQGGDIVCHPGADLLMEIDVVGMRVLSNRTPIVADPAKRRRSLPGLSVHLLFAQAASAWRRPRAHRRFSVAVPFSESSFRGRGDWATLLSPSHVLGSADQQSLDQASVAVWRLKPHIGPPRGRRHERRPPYAAAWRPSVSAAQ